MSSTDFAMIPLPSFANKLKERTQRRSIGARLARPTEYPPAATELPYDISKAWTKLAIFKDAWCIFVPQVEDLEFAIFSLNLQSLDFLSTESYSQTSSHRGIRVAGVGVRSHGIKVNLLHLTSSIMAL